MNNFDLDVAYIVYASDDKFAEILGCSLVSLYENSKDMEKITVYIFDAGISDVNKAKLQQITRNYKNRNIIFIRGKDISERLSMKITVDRGSLSQYARLFVSSELPQTLNRVIYLDCDTIVNQSIRELWNLDIQGKTIGALMDAFSRYYRANIGLEDNDILFNSGVMLIDLEKWREKNVERRLMDFIVKRHGRIQQGDQGALNYVLAHDTYCFEPRFNSVTIFYDFSYEEMMTYRKPPAFYTKEQICEAVENPVLIHFTSSFLSKRVWMKGCKHRYVEKWLQYKQMSPWCNQPPWDDDRPLWRRVSAKMILCMPRRLGIGTAGILQAYARPILNGIITG